MRIFVILAMVLLAGCTADDGDPIGAPSDEVQQGTGESKVGSDASRATPFIQSLDISWQLPLSTGCQGQAEEPEAMAGITYGRADIDEQTWGKPYRARFVDAEPGGFIAIKFYTDAGDFLDGLGMIPAGVYPANEEPVLEGLVPEQAARAMFLSCASATRAAYEAGDLPEI